MFKRKTMILDEVIRKTKEELEKKKDKYPMDWLGRSLAYNPFMPRDVKPYLQATPNNPYRIIAEIHKPKPKQGYINHDFVPLLIAKAYEIGGADAISVLTEPLFFQGNLEYLTQIRRYVATPLLRKDVIVDKYQVLESLVYGADFIVLIAKILSKQQLKTLLEYTFHLGLEALVEIHDKEDLTKAIFAGATLISINHHDQESSQKDINLSEKLISLIPNGKIIVLENALYDKKAIEHLSAMGVDAFLIDMCCLSKNDIEASLKTMKEVK